MIRPLVSLLALSLLLAAAVGTTAAAQTLYVTDGATIKRVAGDSAEVVVSGLAAPADLAVHDGALYWSDPGSGKIQRARLDSVVVEDLVTGVDNPRGIAVDPVGLKVYWAALGSDRVERADLDGTGRETVISLAPSWNVWDVFHYDGHVYFTDFGGDRIARAPAGGGGPAEFVPLGLNPTNPRGLALDEAGVLYWSYVDYSEPQNRIYSVAPGGPPQSDVLVASAGRPLYITLHDGRLYWVDEGVIRYADVDGQEAGQVGPALGASGGVAVGGPLHHVDFYNVRPRAVPRLLQAGGLGDPNATAAMVAADGTETTEVVVTSDALARALPSGALDVEIAERAARDDLGGVLGTPVHDPAAGTLTVRYTHPRHVANSDLYRTLTLRVVADGDTLGTYPLHVYRPPVLMVHGLWGYPSLWDPMEADMVASGRWLPGHLRKMDYSLSHAHPFAFNQRLLGMEVRAFLGDVVRQGLSASQVDVVTHSMGGLLTRLHVQDPSYPSYSNVNRLIAHNTPHSGSQAGTMLTIVPSTAFLMDVLDLNQGAIDDLSYDSPAINIDLNGPWLNRQTVPTHGVVTVWDTPAVPLLNPIPGLEGQVIGALFLAAAPFFFCDYDTANDLVTALYAGEQSDLIVSVPSQRGGLAAPYVTADLPEHYHMGSVQAPAAIDRTVDLLEADPESSALFTQSGFQPPVLAYQLGMCGAGLQQQRRPVLDGTLSITSPVSGSVVAPGATVAVTVTGDPDLTHVMYAAGGGAVPTQTDGGPGSSGSFTFEVPLSAAGRLPVVALGVGPAGLVADTVYVSVSVPDGLDSLKVGPSDVLVEANMARPVTLVGHFSDGVVRTLSGVPGVEYGVEDPAVASISDGELTGLEEGTTVLTGSYRGLTASAAVTVFPSTSVSAEPSPPSAGDPSGGVRLRGVRPNPTGGLTRVAFELPRGADLLVEVFDLLGRRLSLVDAGTHGPGAGTVDLDVRGLNAGVYLCRLTASGTGGGSSATGRLTVVR